MTKKIQPTMVMRLLDVLADGRWHSTKELRRRVGGSFGVAKFYLVTYHGYVVERRPHPTLKNHYQYRLLDEPID